MNEVTRCKHLDNVDWQFNGSCLPQSRHLVAGFYSCLTYCFIQCGNSEKGRSIKHQCSHLRGFVMKFYCDAGCVATLCSCPLSKPGPPNFLLSLWIPWCPFNISLSLIQPESVSIVCRRSTMLGSFRSQLKDNSSGRPSLAEGKVACFSPGQCLCLSFITLSTSYQYFICLPASVWLPIRV